MTVAEATWVAVGIGGQVCFTLRMLVQWLASERRKKSVVPIAFWYLSLCGGSILLAYAIHRRDPVFILGQATGVFIYVRNLILIRRSVCVSHRFVAERVAFRYRGCRSLVTPSEPGNGPSS